MDPDPYIEYGSGYGQRFEYGSTLIRNTVFNADLHPGLLLEESFLLMKYLGISFLKYYGSYLYKLQI